MATSDSLKELRIDEFLLEANCNRFGWNSFFISVIGNLLHQYVTIKDAVIKTLTLIVVYKSYFIYFNSAPQKGPTK